jgi:WhiB family transcriptional regulator, redox-sensing transcriptional regulator
VTGHPSRLPAAATPAEGWRESALCLEVGPELFFPDKGESPRAARRVCSSCGVRAECLAYALDHDEQYGVWGGMSERQRRRIAEARLLEAG